MLAIIFVAGLVGSGCQTHRTIYVEIQHPPLDQAPVSYGTRLLVKPFVDQRENQEKLGQFEYMGSTIDYFALPDVKVEEVLTLSIIDALNAAGYKAELMKNLPDAEKSGIAIVEGNVKEFSVSMQRHRTRCAIQLQMLVRSPTTHLLSHGKLIVGEDESTLWTGAPAEYGGIAMRAMERLLKCAMADFATTEFQNAIR